MSNQLQENAPKTEELLTAIFKEWKENPEAIHDRPGYSDGTIHRLSFELDQFTRSAYKKLKSSYKPGGNISPDQLTLLRFLRELPWLISRQVRGNAGLFSSDQNTILAADQAIFNLVNLLSVKQDQITDRAGHCAKIQQNIDIISELAKNPDTLDKAAYKRQIALNLLLLSLATLATLAFLVFCPLSAPALIQILPYCILTIGVPLIFITMNNTEHNSEQEALDFFAKRTPKTDASSQDRPATNPKPQDPANSAINPEISSVPSSSSSNPSSIFENPYYSRPRSPGTGMTGIVKAIHNFTPAGM